MATQWGKTAFLCGLGGVTGRTLTVECPDRAYRYGEPGELDATLTVRDERFIRTWDLHPGSCEATFLERHTGLFQLQLVKNGAQRALFDEPWSETAREPRAAAANGSEV